MTQDNEQSKANQSSAVSDETLRLYLLGRLNEDERLRLDECLLVDEEFAIRVRLAESELIDDYAAGRLDPVERELCANTFLVTEERRRKLHFVANIQDYAGAQNSAAATQSTSQPTKPSWREGFAGLFAFPSPRAWATAGSFAVLILVLGLAWFLTRPRRETPPVIVKNEPVPVFSPQAKPQTAASPVAVTPSPEPSPVRKPPPAPSPTEPSVPSTIASFVLVPGAIRGSGDLPRIAVPNGERDIVRLSMVLETTVTGPYRAELATAEGQSVLVRNNLKSSSGKAETKVVLEVPARLLHGGDYQIKVSRPRTDGQPEIVGRYYFRALQE
jgi:hypothetical protein